MTLPRPLAALEAAHALATAAERSGDAWFWLDGEAAAPGERRVSYLGVSSEVRESEPGREWEFLEALRAAGVASVAASPSATNESATAAPPIEGADAGFEAGWIVGLGYEFGVGLMGGTPHPDAAAPAFAVRASAVLTVNHDTGESSITGDPVSAARLKAALTGLRSSAPIAHEAAPSSDTDAATGAVPIAERSDARLSHSPAAAWRDNAYEQHVEECRGAIRRGDAYVLCLTDTATAETRRTPLELYEQLRGGTQPAGTGTGAPVTAAMRGAVIALPHRALVSASPERFLTVRGRIAATHPIKGTRPRGATPAVDSALAEELAADPKERAENLMIVDLMRNDLSRVCEVGSVRVSRFLAVETHPRVHQLVSTIEGELATGRDVFDAIAACFPGGSMTGAPKHSAVAILGALEGGPRGLYSGCFGWIGDDGDAELAMTIRGIELRPSAPGSVLFCEGSAARALVGAGGGITVDSDPHRERAERDLKAAAMLTVL